MATTLVLAVLEVVIAIVGRFSSVIGGKERSITTQTVTPIIVLVFQATLLADYMSRVYRTYRRRQEIDRLEEMAYTDALTGLESRASFEEREKARLQRRGEYTIAFIDVDGLKKENDLYGHKAGDVLLMQVSGAIRRGCLHAACRGFRYGGDEFLITGPDAQSVRRALAHMETELARTKLPGGRTASVSTGISSHRKTSQDTVEDIVRQADSNMYRQKQKRHAARTES